MANINRLGDSRSIRVTEISTFQMLKFKVVDAVVISEALYIGIHCGEKKSRKRQHGNGIR